MGRQGLAQFVARCLLLQAMKQSVCMELHKSGASGIMAIEPNRVEDCSNRLNWLRRRDKAKQKSCPLIVPVTQWACRIERNGNSKRRICWMIG